MRKNAQEVMNAWVNGNPLDKNTIRTDGEYVYSYELKIAFRGKYGRCSILSPDMTYRKFSKTTASHINACRATYPHAERVGLIS